MNIHILKWSCPDKVGLLARITTLLAGAQANLLDVGQYTDPLAQRFFARLAFDMIGSDADLRDARSGLKDLAQEVDAEWQLRPASRRYKTAIFVSRFDHCLLDLLWRWRSGELRTDIVFVLSNHEDCRAIVEREGIPFYKVSFDEAKSAAFLHCADLLRSHQIDLTILARFMQILPDWFCAEWPGRIINIHHSFLPAFVGANPYRKAFERGVKLIGATCHYATKELDAGPIIEQEVARVEHYHEPDDLVRMGRDCERLALARGVRFHIEDRVLLHGNRAIVFRD